MTRQLDDITSDIARAIKPETEVRLLQALDEATDNQGNPKRRAVRFIELEDRDGVVWRVRVNTSGTLTTSLAPS